MEDFGCTNFSQGEVLIFLSKKICRVSLLYTTISDEYVSFSLFPANNQLHREVGGLPLFPYEGKRSVFSQS